MECAIMSEPDQLVSVIITNYNYGRYLNEAIDSVLAQSYKKIEIIVVDDGSSDNSHSILKTYRHERIKIIYQENMGQAAAFNIGFENCKGRYIAFLDSDDVWYPQKIEKTVECFSNNNISLVQHNLDIIDLHSKRLGGEHPGVNRGMKNIVKEYFRLNHTGFFSATSGIVCKKKNLNKIFPLPIEWKICADVAFTRPLPIFGYVLTHNKNLGAYRIHGSNNWMRTKQQSDNWIKNNYKYCSYTNHWLENYGFDQRIDFSKSQLLKKRKRLIYKNIFNRFMSIFKTIY